MVQGDKKRHRTFTPESLSEYVSARGRSRPTRRPCPHYENCDAGYGRGNAIADISVHVEAYASPEAVQEEEFSPAYALRADAPLIIPIDDAYAQNNAMRTPARIISYGMSEQAEVQVSHAGFCEERGMVIGMSANIVVGGEGGKICVKGSVGITQLLPLAQRSRPASAFEIPVPDALQALEAV